MKHGKSETEGRQPRGRAWRVRRRCCAAVRVALFLLIVVGASAPTAWGQGSTAIVTGAQRVYVRRGPGPEFPPFGTLPQGSKVEVQAMEGEWSRVVTPSGQGGYMHSNFLRPEGEEAGAAVEAPEPGGANPPPTAPDTSALAALTERNKSLEAQVSALQAELGTAKSRADETPAVPVTPAVTADEQALQAEMQRLATAVEAIQRRLDGGPGIDAGASTTTPLQGKPAVVSPTALLLGGFGLLVGWLIGTAYGRNQERGRRSRIRF